MRVAIPRASKALFTKGTFVGLGSRVLVYMELKEVCFLLNKKITCTVSPRVVNQPRMIMHANQEAGFDAKVGGAGLCGAYIDTYCITIVPAFVLSASLF